MHWSQLSVAYFGGLLTNPKVGQYSVFFWSVSLIIRGSLYPEVQYLSLAIINLVLILL